MVRMAFFVFDLLNRVGTRPSGHERQRDTRAMHKNHCPDAARPPIQAKRPTPLNFSRRDSSPPQLSASCTLQPPLSLTRRGQSRRGNRSPQDRDRCGARSVRARQAGRGIWPADFERPRRHRPRCVRRPPQPRSLRRRKAPQRFPYPHAYGSETAATPPNGHVRQERATETDFRPGRRCGGPAITLRSFAPRCSSSNRLPSNFCVLSAMTTVFGSAIACRRAARFGVSPTTACC